jgi:deoxyribose-phosphate aldolase
MVAMYAGADFIKTSTGKEAVNATLPIGLVMCRAIRHFYQQTGIRVSILITAHQWCFLANKL